MHSTQLPQLRPRSSFQFSLSSLIRLTVGLAVLLASDASEWITGAIIPMDGGNMAMNAGGTPGHQKRVVQSFRAEERK